MRLAPTSTGKAPSDWLAHTTRCRFPLMRPNASRSWRQPFENCTWLIAMVAERGASPSVKDSRRRTPSTAGTKRTCTPRWIHGCVTAGNSSSSDSTGPSRSRRSAMRFMPVEVLGTKAISAGSAPTNRATRRRTASRLSIQSSQCRSPPSSSSRWKAVTASRTGRGVSDVAAAFR